MLKKVIKINAAIVRYGFKILNQLKRHPRSQGSLRSRPSKQERERERWEGRESRLDQGLFLSLALRVEYGEDPGYKVADTNWLRN